MAEISKNAKKSSKNVQKWRFWAKKWPKKAFSGVQNP